MFDSLSLPVSSASRDFAGKQFYAGSRYSSRYPRVRPRGFIPLSTFFPVLMGFFFFFPTVGAMGWRDPFLLFFTLFSCGTKLRHHRFPYNPVLGCFLGRGGPLWKHNGHSTTTYLLKRDKILGNFLVKPFATLLTSQIRNAQSKSE